MTRFFPETLGWVLPPDAPPGPHPAGLPARGIPVSPTQKFKDVRRYFNDVERRLGWIVSILLVGCVISETVHADQTVGYTEVQRVFLREDFESVTMLAHTFLIRNTEAPELGRVWIWLVLSLDRLQRAPEALNELDLLKGHLAVNDSLWPEVLFWEGDISRRTFQMARAKSAFERLAKRYPDSTWTVQAQLGLGLIALHQQLFESAIGYFHAVVVQHSESAVALDARLFEGLCHLRLGQFKEALTLFQPLVEQLSEPAAIAQTAYYLGESFSGLGLYEQAVPAYQRAIASSTASKARQWGQVAQFGLGWAYYQMGHCAESVEAFERYRSYKPLDHPVEALFAQGSCFLRLGKEDRAIPLFEQIVSRDSGHPLALESGLAIVDAYRRQERFALAKELIHTLLRWPLDANSRAKVQLRLGAVALEQGNATQAHTVFALARQSDDPAIQQAALNGLGDVQMYVGDLPGALRQYEDARQLGATTSGAAYATYQVGRIRLQLGARNEAIAIFQQLTTSGEPTLADDALLALALAHVNQHEPDVARALLGTIRRERPESATAARAAYYLAVIALGEGDDAAAEQLCEETITKAAKSDEAMDAWLLLADLRASRTSVEEVMAWLHQVFVSSELPLRHRASVAKRLGDLARAQSHYSEAIRWYEAAMELLQSLSGEALYHMAFCYEEAGDIELAKSRYQSIEHPPWQVRGQLALAKLLEREGRVDEAEAIYVALASQPIPEAKVVQERLAVLQRPTPRRAQ